MGGSARWIASGLGCGFSPKAPGTVGSAVALAIGAGLWVASPWLVAFAAAVATVLGIWAIRQVRSGDAGWIVIDEFAGQWIAMLGMASLSWPWLLAAFALFRLFDIWKPGPVGWADRWHTPVGVMADDIVAGAMAAAVLVVVRLV